MKIVKEAYIKSLITQVSVGDISFSRMVELINSQIEHVETEAEKLLHFSAKMKFYRTITGISLQALAVKMNNIVTRQALHRYEKREVEPKEDVKLLILKTLKHK